jgi:hypothetical protein
MSSRLLAGLGTGAVLLGALTMTRGIGPSLGVGVVAGGLVIFALQRGSLKLFPSSSPSSDEEPLEALKRRYVDGSMSHETYEEKLETLFRTETVADLEGDLPGEATKRETPAPEQPTTRTDAGPQANQPRSGRCGPRQRRSNAPVRRRDR